LLAVLGGALVAWHGSVQHEAVHGHPTGRPWIDAVVAGVPLSLWLPFSLYRSSHLAHHATADLTSPVSDPESYMTTHARWQAAGPIERAWRWTMNTLAGRLVLGPPWVVVRTWASEAHAAARGDRSVATRWLLHSLFLVPVVMWIVGICGMSLSQYALCFVYPGLSLTLLRSFVEHRYAHEPEHRTVVVESPLLGWLFLHNNLHVVHHARPGLPWYEIPAVYRRNRARLLRRNGGRWFRGYAEVARRYAIRPYQHPAVPRAPIR
jgi:fatty acid desaturase